MKCYKPILIRKNLDQQIYPDGLLVPCGQCLACKEEIAKEYTLRYCMHKNESKLLKTAFLTLTYNAENLPINDHYQMTLRKQDIVDYLKACREKLRRDSKKTNQKLLNYLYYLSGEYGEEKNRPHYHIVLSYNNKRILNEFVRRWEQNKGNVKCYDNATIQSIFYTIGYVDKKIGLQGTGTREKLFRKFTKGMGKNWILKNAEEVNNKMYCILSKFKIGIPRYFKKKLNDLGLWTTDKKTYEKIRQRKTEEDNKLLELYNQKYIKKESYTYKNWKKGIELEPNIYERYKSELPEHYIEHRGKNIFAYIIQRTKITIDEYKDSILKQRKTNYETKAQLRGAMKKLNYDPL